MKKHNDAVGIRNMVSIVIVNYNGMAVLQECLRSVHEHTTGRFEVILVDNGSSDGGVEIVRKKFSGVRIIENAENRGFAEGNNQGVAAARGEFVALLNNDTVVGKHWLSSLKKTLGKPGVEVVTSKVVTDGIPSSWYEMNGSINYLGYNIMRVFQDLSVVFFAGGASLLFRKAIVGLPFLSEYFLYQEDVYLSWKMRLLGHKVTMSQESFVAHRGSISASQQPSTLVTFYQERNRLLNCILFYRPWTLVRLLPYFIADALAKISLSIVGSGKSLKGILKAYGWVLGHMPWVLSQRAKIQRERTVNDRAILELMSYKIMDSDARVARIANRLSRLYADIVRLRYHA